MQQPCTYGSVRGATGDCRPYRDKRSDGIRPAMHPRATPTRKERAPGTPGGRRCSFLEYRPDILGRRALPTGRGPQRVELHTLGTPGRLARLGARRSFHHGLLAPGPASAASVLLLGLDQHGDVIIGSAPPRQKAVVRIEAR
jgi:hypothetical protein